MKRTLRKKRQRDRQLEEFEKRDLGEDIKNSRAGVVIRPKFLQRPTSILLPPALIAKLCQKANKRGIGYQTLLKIIVHDHVDDY